MDLDSIDTIRVQNLVERWQAGDSAAADELVRAVGQRLERMTRKMLRGFPAVRACTETADVLQVSLIRLLNTLRRMQPESKRHFFNLAAVHVRRELLDLARRFRGTAFVRVAPPDAEFDGDVNAAEARAQDSDLDLWCRFHEAVDELPPEEREVVSLVFYHGCTQAQIAELFQVDERTVRRRWRSACLNLRRLVGDVLPNS
jgi:RNA polymerase sigma factor (sigma-70 family)